MLCYDWVCYNYKFESTEDPVTESKNKERSAHFKESLFGFFKQTVKK